MLNQRPLTNPAGADRRRPLSDITSTSLNRIAISGTETVPGQPRVTKCEPACARNVIINPPGDRNDSLANLGSVCVPQDPSEPGEHTLRLSVHNSLPLKLIPIWDVRCRALWCMELSSFDIFVKPAEVLALGTRYQDVVHPCLASKLAWLTSQNEALYTHFTALEQEPRYQWDLSYIHRLKKVTNTDRAEIVDIMIYFGMRVRLHHPTVHLAVSILDRYLSLLFCTSATTSYSEVGDSEAVKVLLRRPYAMKSLACACIWLAATLEEIQKHFDPHWFHEVLFLRTNRPPTLPQLSQLMNSVAKELNYDLLAPTVHTFLCRLVPLAKFSGEDVQVARCLSERALLEPPACQTNTTTSTSSSAQSKDSTVASSCAILGAYLPSCIAAACVFLARAHMLALRHQLPMVHSCDEEKVTVESSVNATEEVWTAALTRFSGYTAAQLQPCVTALHSILQLETYQRARLYAHTLCPSGCFDDLEVTVQAMTSPAGQCDSTDCTDEGIALDKKQPLQEYLKLLPQILTHMQSAIVSSVGALTTAVEPTNSSTPIVQNATIVSTSSVQSFSSSAATTVAAAPYLPRFRTFGRTLSTESTVSTTATAVHATTPLLHEENNSLLMLAFGSQVSELSQLTNQDFSQGTLPTGPTTGAVITTYSRVPSRQVPEKTVDTMNSGYTTSASVAATTSDGTTIQDGPISKRLRTKNPSYPIATIARTAPTSPIYATTLTATDSSVSNENSFFDPAQLMYSQDGLSNPFPQYVHNSTLSKEKTTFSSFVSALGKRRYGDSENGVASGAYSNSNMVYSMCEPAQAPPLDKVLTLNSHLQDVYKLYPSVSIDAITSNRATATATAMASIQDIVSIPNLLDHSITNTKEIPIMRESVRLKYYSVYSRLVTCPPL